MPCVLGHRMGLFDHLYTLYLFTVSDFKTIMLPITAFACVAGPVSSPTSFSLAFVWTWIHLLQCNISNQYKGVEEDLLNKPWRPIPSGRLSLESAGHLRWLMLFLCIGISALGGGRLFAASIGFLLTVFVYDETSLSKNWIGKNVGGVFGYGTMEAGATMLMQGECDLDFISVRSLLLLAAVVMSTLHAQDFPDVLGDKAMNRITFPILYPAASRVCLSICALGWSGALASFWGLGYVCFGAYLAIGALVAGRFMHYRTVEADKISYVYYNIWLMVTMLLPMNARWKVLCF